MFIDPLRFEAGPPGHAEMEGFSWIITTWSGSSGIPRGAC